MTAYKFSECATSIKPDNEITRLLEKAQDNKPLNREEKDKIANILYGLFGAQSSTYKLAGWAWPMSDCLTEILVSATWDNGKYETYFAPDKTSLRKALPYPIKRMVYA